MVTGLIELARRITQRAQRQTKPGSHPGAIVPHRDQPKPFVCAIAYGPDKCPEHDIVEVSKIRDRIGTADVLWVDVGGLGDAETTSQIGEIFRLHHLALEDVVNVHQRPKVEAYGDQFRNLRKSTLQGLSPSP